MTRNFFWKIKPFPRLAWKDPLVEIIYSMIGVIIAPTNIAAKLRNPEDVVSDSGYEISEANSNPIGRYPVMKNPRIPTIT